MRCVPSFIRGYKSGVGIFCDRLVIDAYSSNERIIKCMEKECRNCYILNNMMARGLIVIIKLIFVAKILNNELIIELSCSRSFLKILNDLWEINIILLLKLRHNLCVVPVLFDGL
jgi:hypothetical protein